MEPEISESLNLGNSDIIRINDYFLIIINNLF